MTDFCRRFFGQFFVVMAVAVWLGQPAQAGTVAIQANQLFIDGQAQPQIFAAELQYFRLRGGYEPNQPRAKVIELWNKALDRMVEAKMNAVSFYIPWDFHEYAEGKFDFTGTVDEDGDGKPDYPSRDIFTFFRLIEEHGIRTIMVRPGPYINAEWGFLGFGAIPRWFHNKYPESHMQSPTGFRTSLYDYHNPDFLRHSQLWLAQVYSQVLKNYIGPGKPISFIQLDNETNFMWQSIYNHDYGARAVERYRAFLRTRYSDLPGLNRAHGRSWSDWSKVQPPRAPGLNSGEDQDWYRFQDESIHTYLQNIRKIWEGLGVAEPQVLFTLAESYNAPANGLLPNYHDRNNPNKTGLMTVNLYPKTYESSNHSLMNFPFKADIDVKSADSANDYYLGAKQEWVMGPEIQGGWFPGTNVVDESRRQTYLTTIGRGMKALFVYYFTEGDNWQVEGTFQNKKLSFDAPLDGDANPRSYYQSLKEIGEKIIAPYGRFLARASDMTDPVCILRDVREHAPTAAKELDSVVMNGEWAGGLLGFLAQAGVNPRIVHFGLTPAPLQNRRLDLSDCRLVLRQDNGQVPDDLAATLKGYIASGGVVVNLVNGALAKRLGLRVTQQLASDARVIANVGGDFPLSRFANSRATQNDEMPYLTATKLLVDPSASEPPAVSEIPLTLLGSAIGSPGDTTLTARATPLYKFDLAGMRNCQALLRRGSDTVGYQCTMGAGRFVQIGAVTHDRFNSDTYESINDVPQRRRLIEGLLQIAKVTPRVAVSSGGDRVAVFGRSDETAYWITAKSGQLAPTTFKVRVQGVAPESNYRVRDVMSLSEQTLTGQTLAETGFAASLAGNGATAFYIERIQ